MTRLGRVGDANLVIDGATGETLSLSCDFLTNTIELSPVVASANASHNPLGQSTQVLVDKAHFSRCIFIFLLFPEARDPIGINTGANNNRVEG